MYFEHILIKISSWTKEITTFVKSIFGKVIYLINIYLKIILRYKFSEENILEENIFNSDVLNRKNIYIGCD